MKIEFLSADQVIIMHDALLKRWGGASGGGHRGVNYEGIEAAVQAVKNSYYETVEELGAAYAVYIIQGHVFMDGNKRSGGAAMLTFLHRHDVRTDLELGDISELMLVLQTRAEKGQRTDKLIEWLADALANG